MDSNEIIGKFETKRGNTYIFLANGNILEMDLNKNTKLIDLKNTEVIQKIKDEIGTGLIDVESIFEKRIQ